MVIPVTFANLIPVNLREREISSESTDAATGDDLGSFAYVENNDEGQISSTDWGGTTDGQLSQLTGTETDNPDNQSIGLAKQGGMGNQDDPLDEFSDQPGTGGPDITEILKSSDSGKSQSVFTEKSGGFLSPVLLANQDSPPNTPGNDGENCNPGGASDVKNLDSRQKEGSCMGPLTQIPFPFEIPTELPLLRVPNVPAVGTPETESPQLHPKSPPYKKPTKPWPRPDSPIRTPVTKDTCGPDRYTLCCQGIVKYVKPSGASNFFSGIYSNLAVQARYDVDACIDCMFPSARARIST